MEQLAFEAAVDIRRSANVSECRRYRYSLDRKWFPDRFYSPAKIFRHPMPLIFVMLNPSTADAYSDDPTIRRCIGFAKREGYEWLRVINLYGGRATKPADLFKMSDPVGPDNTTEWEMAREFHEQGAEIVCAWGAEPKARERAAMFTAFMNEARVGLWCLGVTKAGCPKHPLYLPNNAALTAYPAQAMEARSGETRSGSTEGDSAVAKPCAQDPSGSNRHG